MYQGDASGCAETTCTFRAEDFYNGFEPGFNHVLSGFWELAGTLWLYPGTDTVTFDLGPDESVPYARVTFTDYCGLGCTTVEFIGTEGAALFSNTSVGTEEIVDTVGLGLGEIVLIMLQSSEGRFDEILINIQTGSDCPADFDDDGDIGFPDLLSVLSAWGQSGPQYDLDASGFVDFGDLLAILSNWGPC